MKQKEYKIGDVFSKIGILYGRPDIIKIVSGPDEWIVRCCGLEESDKPFYINHNMLGSKYKQQTTLFETAQPIARKMWADKYIKTK